MLQETCFCFSFTGTFFMAASSQLSEALSLFGAPETTRYIALESQQYIKRKTTSQPKLQGF